MVREGYMDLDLLTLDENALTTYVEAGQFESRIQTSHHACEAFPCQDEKPAPHLSLF